jgi:hypothetical protein
VNPQFTGAGGISEFQMAANGALTPVAGSPLAFSSSMPMSLAADPLGRLIFGASATDIYTFSINASTGALTQVAMIAPLPPVAYSAHTNSSSANDFAGPMVVDHAGSFLYALTMCAADGGVNTISPYLGYPLPDVVPVPPAITLSPGGGFLLASQQMSNSTPSITGSVVSVFAVDTNTGNLTAVSGSPFTLGVANASPNGSPNSTVAVNVTQPRFAAETLRPVQSRLDLLFQKPVNLERQTRLQSAVSNQQLDRTVFSGFWNAESTAEDERVLK